MDKNKIKSFAIWARRNLIAAVSEKANRIGISESKIEDATVVQGGFKLEGKDEIFPLSKSDRDALVSQVKEKGFEQVMEEVAYTWFNRFIGLRYMEVNDYIPSGIRVLSSSIEGKIEPDVLTKVSEIIDELGLNADDIYGLLDTGDIIDREEAYRIIIVKQCNQLGEIIPQMFEKIKDYTEMLLPDNLLQESSVLRKLVEDIREDDWKNDIEIIGWVYQYYNDERKNEVINIYKGTVKKDDIPAATQLFTTDWIVKYMVDNSLGKMWMDNNPTSKLKYKLKYYIESSNENNVNIKRSINVEDIKFLDPCMGSGHILLYAFDIFLEIYRECGYSDRDATKLIITKNLFGLDIDDRASQLAYFVILMKARRHNRRIFKDIKREDITLSICAIKDTNNIESFNDEIIFDIETKSELNYLLDKFKDAKEIGSIQKIEKKEYYKLLLKVKDFINEKGVDNLFIYDKLKKFNDTLPSLVKQAEILSEKYDVVVTNPPYLSKMDGNLKKFVNQYYKKYSGDLFSVFIYRNFDFCKVDGYTAFMTPLVWMFIKSYENLRDFIINEKSISSLIQLEYSAFEEATVPICTFVLKNSKNKKIGKYIRLVDFKGGMEVQEKKVIEAINGSECKYIYESNCDNYNLIPGKPISYWISMSVYDLFKKQKSLSSFAEPKSGLSTTDNIRFLRYWSEIDFNNIGFGYSSTVETKKCKKRWFPYNKGGSYRKWYGNRYYCVNWYNDGQEIKEAAKGASGGRVVNPEYYFKECITWSSLSSGDLSIRYSEEGFIFDSKGSSCFTEKYLKYLLGFMNSKVAMVFLKVLCPTLDFNPGSIAKLPIIATEEKVKDIECIVEECIEISKEDWNMFEISWEFLTHPLVKLSREYQVKSIKKAFEMFNEEREKKFIKLKENEEKLNDILINLYGLEDELNSNIEEKEITVRKAERDRDIKSFISYSIGCILGRYSIDIDGLIYAGGNFKDKWNIDNNQAFVRNMKQNKDGNRILDSWINTRFIPDMDNIIPITEEEYFEDDIVSRFINFIGTVYGNDTLEENLDFIADSIGRKASETSRQAIRRYFIKDFYKDHLKVYQKRPIYWMFESGKNDGFKCLVYMHRYDEQTVAKVRTEYLHTLQRKYESEINRLQLVVDSEEYTAKDRTAAKKKIDRISKQLEECKDYDQVVAHLANEKISIDLDDGVKVNYDKFQDIRVINSKGKEVKMNLLSKI